MSSYIIECSECREQFKYDDLIVVPTKVCGTTINSKGCPYCKSTSYTALKDIGWFNKYLIRYGRDEIR